MKNTTDLWADFDATSKPNTFRLPKGIRPSYVLVPGIDPDGGLVAVFTDGSYSRSWMPAGAREALAATAGTPVRTAAA